MIAALLPAGACATPLSPVPGDQPRLLDQSQSFVPSHSPTIDQNLRVGRPGRTSSDPLGLTVDVWSTDLFSTRIKYPSNRSRKSVTRDDAPVNYTIPDTAGRAASDPDSAGLSSLATLDIGPGAHDFRIPKDYLSIRKLFDRPSGNAPVPYRLLDTAGGAASDPGSKDFSSRATVNVGPRSHDLAPGMIDTLTIDPIGTASDYLGVSIERGPFGMPAGTLIGYIRGTVIESGAGLVMPGSNAASAGALLGPSVEISLGDAKGEGDALPRSASVEQPTAVPEPGTLFLVGMALTGLGAWGRKRLFKSGNP
jgi:PEP-CTERM motif